MTAESGPLPALLDGVLVPASAAHVALHDPAFTHGDGLFETVRVVAGRPVALGAHLGRMLASAEALGMASPPESRWVALADELLAAAPALPEVALRLQLCGPRPPREATTVLTLRPLGAREATRRSGLELWTVPWARAPRGGLGTHKLTSWAATPVATRTHPRGQDPAFEVVFTEGAELLEGGTSALAVLVGDALCLPPLDGRILASVTRARLVALAPRLGLNVVERPLSRADVAASEAVLALNALLPVAVARSLDGHPLRGAAADVVGAITAALAAPA